MAYSKIIVMNFSFQSIRSGSSGNCLLIKTSQNAVLLDFGLKTKRLSYQILDSLKVKVSAAVVSHCHSDHINTYSYRVLKERGIPVYCHEKSLRGVLTQIDRPDTEINTFNGSFSIASMNILPFELPHRPDCSNYGFIFEYKNIRVAIATDFYSWDDSILHLLADCDFLFLESNHDSYLLTLNPNPNSCYHLSNHQASNLLSEMKRKKRALPKTIMFGHLSQKRNQPHLPENELKKHFFKHGINIDSSVFVAPSDCPSQEIFILPATAQIASKY